MVLGCRERGKPSDGPFDHTTGQGWVKGVRGQYADALQKRTQVNVVLVESTGGIARGTWTRMRRLGRRAEGKGSVDRTKYGRVRRSTKSFVAHHGQQLCKAAVVGDARQIKCSVIQLKQRAFGAGQPGLD